MRVPEWLLRHRITVEAYDGDSAYGPTYRPPVEVRALVAAVGGTVRKQSDGVEVVANAQIIAGPDLDCPPESRITLPDGRIAVAARVNRHTAPGLPAPQSTEVICE
ncbi:hypothetical protein [Streptomyces sp. NPDC094032]|uniref:hypothetical protein n=1 Tax=Streptomyces sp. NPDC094032 TaxID=3155308 RepID=UPI003324178B